MAYILLTLSLHATRTYTANCTPSPWKLEREAMKTGETKWLRDNSPKDCFRAAMFYSLNFLASRSAFHE